MTLKLAVSRSRLSVPYGANVFFTSRLRSKFIIKSLLKIPSYQKHVATLSCEMFCIFPASIGRWLGVLMCSVYLYTSNVMITYRLALLYVGIGLVTDRSRVKNPPAFHVT